MGSTWTFTGSASDPDGDELTFAWELGDGAQLSGQQVEHVYDQPGSYTVTVTVSDPGGASDQASVQVEVVDRAPTAVLAVTPTDPTAGDEVTFDASASDDPDGQPLSYAWDVDGDGVRDATGDVPQLTYVYTRNTVGRAPFAATVTVSDGVHTTTSEAVEVTVANAPPVAVIAQSPTDDIDATTDVTFDASGSTDVEDGQLQVAWDLGDGTTSTSTAITHRYVSSGTYTVTLVVTDADGASATATREVTVINARPVVVTSPEHPQGRPGEPITVDASGSFDPDGSALSFRWTARQHEPGTGPSYTVSFAEEGTYRVWITVTDAEGASVSVPVDVRVDQDLVYRVAGATRVDTGVALSQRAFDRATQAVLARADDFPDALAASPLAAQVDGPILLTSRDELSPAVGAELSRLGVTHVYLAGGPAALGPAIESDLRSRGIAFTRLAGQDRFATAAAIAQELTRLNGRAAEAIVALGAAPESHRAWPDALVAGNIATRSRVPVLLASPAHLPDTTREALRANVGGTRVWMIGGNLALTDAVEERLEADGWDARRLAGPDRYATAVVVTEEARRRGASPEPTVLASGRNFPDALAATVAAWRLGGALLLVDPMDLRASDATFAWLRHHRETVDTVLLAGGPAAVADHVRLQVQDRIEDGTPD